MTDSEELRNCLQNEIKQLECCLLRLEADLESLRQIVPREVTASADAWIEAHAAAERIHGIMQEAAWTAGGMEVKWVSRQEFDELAEKLCQQLADTARRQRSQETLRRLIDSLEGGRVHPHNPRKQPEYERLRQQTLAALKARIERDAAVLPNCGGAEWLNWAWQHEGFIDRMDQMRSNWPELVRFLEEVDPRWWMATQPQSALFLQSSPEAPTQLPAVVSDYELAPTANNAGEPELSGTELVSTGINSQHPLTDSISTAIAEEDRAATAIPESVAVESGEFKNFDESSFMAKEEEVEPSSSGQDVGDRQEAANSPAVVTRHVRGPSLDAELGSWEAFLDRHWLDPHGTFQPAPWNEKADFIGRLNERMKTVVGVSRCFPNRGTVFAARNDLLLAITGATIGKVGIVKRYSRLAFSGDLLRLRANEEVDAHYLLAVLNHELGQVQFNRWITGSTNGHLAPRDVRRVLVPRLKPSVEKKIAELVEESLLKKVESERLLEVAKARVEQLIEEAVKS